MWFVKCLRYNTGLNNTIMNIAQVKSYMKRYAATNVHFVLKSLMILF